MFPPRSAPSHASVKDVARPHRNRQSGHVSRTPLPHEPAPHQRAPLHIGERAGASGSGTGDVQTPPASAPASLQDSMVGKLGPTSGMVAASTGRQVRRRDADETSASLPVRSSGVNAGFDRRRPISSVHFSTRRPSSPTRAELRRFAPSHASPKSSDRAKAIRQQAGRYAFRTYRGSTLRAGPRHDCRDRRATRAIRTLSSCLTRHRLLDGP